MMAEQNDAIPETQAEALRILVEMIVPASEEYALPGASETAIFEQILNSAARQATAVGTALAALDEAAQETGGSTFVQLDAEARDGTVEAFRRQHPAAADLLATITMQCYYRDARVMRSLQIEVRPPFPAGHEIAQGNWSLLEPVRGRTDFYRKT